MRRKDIFRSFGIKTNQILLTNEYINTSVQKGGIPGIAGYLEHGNMIWEAIQKTKVNKKFGCHLVGFR